MKLIELKDVSKTYKPGKDIKVVALKDASFNIDKGEFVAIMGPSGSGKSTLMHILGLLDRSEKGLYKLAGEEISKKSEKELSRLRNEKIGFVFQTFNLLPRTSAIDNVMLPRVYSRIKKHQKADGMKVLKQVGLEKRSSHKPNELSGGEQQRVAIARALINNPQIILADEPTGNLDSKSAIEIMKILESLNKKGTTVIVVTHEEIIAKMAKKIIHIKDGKVSS